MTTRHRHSVTERRDRGTKEMNPGAMTIHAVRLGLPSSPEESLDSPSVITYRVPFLPINPPPFPFQSPIVRPRFGLLPHEQVDPCNIAFPPTVSSMKPSIAISLDHTRAKRVRGAKLSGIILRICGYYRHAVFRCNNVACGRARLRADASANDEPRQKFCGDARDSLRIVSHG